ncbi:PH domain-containing protein [Actinoallomurus rhizosphaericola]|uniref:PH domain-containing protein n=1 Tax=Actinoallomurus rhizosphaericola TaxID=2952536 RepID=UPI002091D82F|nr:PH domain-containing protein [Actinoallomurus rhizosphaericola]MCO5994388.1 PH domain-containing protein [Actinoallomurus rhizosphaericola]
MNGPYGPGRPPYGPPPRPRFTPPMYGPAPYGYGPPQYGPPPKPPVHFSRGVHRLHMATAVINAAGVVVIAFVLGGYSLLLTQTPDGVALVLTPAVIARFLAVMLPATVVAAAIGFWIWWSLKFWISGDDLVVETGILRRRNRRIPLAHMQAVDVVRPLVSRLFGLAEVRVELAGGDQAETKFRFLGRPLAEQLRAELLARAAGLPGHTPEAPERPYWRVGFGTLLGSQLMKLPVIGALMLLVALLAFGVVFGEPGVLAAALPVLLGLARGVVAPLVMHTNFTAALSPDGLRLRYGLMETRMQTVPPGRVQAVRVVEPVLWRGNGWARIDVTVAGYVGDRQALSSVLLPVAPREVALRMVGLVFPGTNAEAVPLLPAPRSWLAPFRKGEAGTDDRLFVTRRGRVCRRLDVIAHARAQSVRLTAGPFQRLLGLGTVHIDAPPGPVQVAAENRELGEARAIVESAAGRAHRARATDIRTERWAR